MLYTYLKRGVYYFLRRILSDSQTFHRTDRAVGYAIQCLGDKDLAEYTTIDAGEFRDWLVAKGLRSSVSCNLTIVKAVVNQCI